jgi:hypothetical protein
MIVKGNVGMHYRAEISVTCIEAYRIDMRKKVDLGVC